MERRTADARDEHVRLIEAVRSGTVFASNLKAYERWLSARNVGRPTQSVHEYKASLSRIRRAFPQAVTTRVN